MPCMREHTSVCAGACRRFPESPGWRQMVGSMWIALLALSIVGLFDPQPLAWILVIQVLYQGVWCVAAGTTVRSAHARKRRCRGPILC